MPRPILEAAVLILALALFAASQFIAPDEPQNVYQFLREVD